MVAIGVSSPGLINGTVSAQAPNTCALLTNDEVQALAANTSVGDGVPSSMPAATYGTCRYAWGTGTGRFRLGVTVNDGSRMFPGMTPDQIKQVLLKSVKPETTDAVVSDIGETAVFKSDSAYYATATAFLKGRILVVTLDGLDAREKKDQAIALLKSAASRLQPS
jgi:hypothetical protein